MSGSDGAPGGVSRCRTRSVSKVRGEDQRRALDGKNDGWLDQAGDLIGISRAQRGRNDRLHRWKCDDQNRLRIMERRRRVQAQIHGVVLREADGGDVLILSRMQVAHNTNDVDDGSHVCGVKAATGRGSVACLGNEIGGRAIKHIRESLTISIVENNL